MSRERHAEMKERLREEDEFLRKFAAATQSLIKERSEGQDSLAISLHTSS